MKQNTNKSNSETIILIAMFCLPIVCVGLTEPGLFSQGPTLQFTLRWTGETNDKSTADRKSVV